MFYLIFKIRSSVGQSTEVRLTGANESTDHFWNQDLDDLDDVLNVLWLNNYGNIPDSQSNNAAATLDISEQRSPALQHNYEEVFNLFHDPLAFQALPSRQQGVQNQCVVETQSASNPGINVQSKSVQCLFLAENQHLASDEADSGGAHSHVPCVPHVIDNTVQPINSPNTHNASYNMNVAVSGREASSPGVKRSIQNQAKFQTKYSNSEETGNHSPIKRKPTSPMQSSSKLFGILSLILQVFNSPMTPELEERCARVLQRALTEIQNAHFYLQGAQGQQI